MATEIKIHTYNESIIHLSTRTGEGIDLKLTKRNGESVESSIYLTKEDKEELMKALGIL